MSASVFTSAAVHFEKNHRKRNTIPQGNSTTETRLCWTLLRGSGGRNASVMLEGKNKGKKANVRPKIMWFDDIRKRTMLKDYGEVKRSAEDRVAWRAITTFHLRR